MRVVLSLLIERIKENCLIRSPKYQTCQVKSWKNAYALSFLNLLSIYPMYSYHIFQSYCLLLGLNICLLLALSLILMYFLPSEYPTLSLQFSLQLRHHNTNELIYSFSLKVMLVVQIKSGISFIVQSSSIIHLFINSLFF